MTVFSKWTKKIYAAYKKIHFSNMSGAIAFFSIIAIFSICVLLVIVISYIPILQSSVKFSVQNFFPPPIAQYLLLLLSEISLPESYVSIVLASLSCVWSTSKVIKALIRSFDAIYYYDDSQHKQNIFFSITVTLVFEFIIVTILLLLGLENIISSYLLSQQARLPVIFDIWQYLKMLFPAILLFFWLSCIYHHLTSIRTNLKSVWKGSLFSSIGILLLSKFFSLYFNVFSSFPSLLGGLGFIFVFIIWVYYNSVIILFGCFINSVVNNVDNL
jgi:membrane protein